MSREAERSEPSASRDWLTLDPDEEIVWSGSPRLTTIIPAVVAGLVGVAVVAYVAWILEYLPILLAAPVALAVPGYAYLEVTNTEFLVTDRAVYAKTGVLGRRVVQSSLSKVQNSSFSQGITGTLFGYGTVRLEIAGGNDVDFYRIDDPQSVRELVDRATGDEIPGSVEQWRAVLDEVRALRTAIDARGDDSGERR
ncbi:PH domain-containing protein [Halorarius litoreus]|uniref:PH domain-containing protein n=1 Tax=Halorarius litoreus TaxID=2962676 RepID=UPI0020CDC36E|nr:PH domain-containing protein [Halorarius litoreus]